MAKELVVYFSVYGTARIVAEEIAKVNNHVRYYNVTPEMLARYATMELGPDL